MATQVSGEASLIRLVSATVALGEQAAGELEGLPESIQLVPWGWVRSTNGTFLVDDASAAEVVEAFRSQGTDLVIDYEHQSLGGRYASPDGLAPAAGWVSSLEVRPGEGIWGSVRWTPAAARRVLRREYRFLSPVVIIRKGDRKVVALDSVALTNRPAIAGMRPVINSRGELVMEPDEATGEGAAAEESAVEALAAAASAVAAPAVAVTGKEDGMQDELKQLRQLLSADEQASDGEVVRQACSRLADLLEASRQRDAEQRVICAMEAGKVCEAQKEWATRFALRDPAGFDEWVAEAPVVVPMGRVLPEGEGPEGPDDARRRGVIAAARREWRGNTLLQQLTNERAYVDEALQQAGAGLLTEQEM